jgi:hypothetical protein
LLREFAQGVCASERGKNIAAVTAASAIEEAEAQGSLSTISRKKPGGWHHAPEKLPNRLPKKNV